MLVKGPQSFELMSITENAVRMVAPLNAKKLSCRFENFVINNNYAFIACPGQSEILVLRGELLVSFFTSELLTNKITATCKSPFLPLNYHKLDDEKITTISIQDKLLLVGTSKGRIHLYFIKAFEAENLNTTTCKSAGSIPYPVCEAILILTQQLYQQSPVEHIDQLNGKYIVFQENNQSYVSNQFTEEFTQQLNNVQSSQTPEQNSNIVSVYDSIAKYVQLVKNPNNLKLVEKEFYFLNPARQASKLSIQGIDQLNQQMKEIYQNPVDWPKLIYTPGVIHPLVSANQTTASVLQYLKQDTLNYQMTARELGQPYFNNTARITAIDISDEASLCVFSDDSGYIRIFNLQTMLPFVNYRFQLPNTVQFTDEKIDDDDEEDVLLQQLQQQQQQLKNMPTKDIITVVKDDIADKRQYHIDSVAIHPSGLHIVAGAHCPESVFVKLAFCIAVLHIVQNDLQIATLIECDDRIIKMSFDQSGNFLYVLTERKLEVFSFYEMRNIASIELSIRLKYVNQIVETYFTKEHLQIQKDQISFFNEKAPPVQMRIGRTGGFVFISFRDGDLVCFNVYTQQVQQKYLTSQLYNKNVENKFIVDFQLLQSSDFNQENKLIQKNFSESQSSHYHVPIICSFSDGQIAELHLSGVVKVIANAGVNSLNKCVNCLGLLHGFQQISLYRKGQQLYDEIKNEQLVSALLLGQKEHELPRQYVITAGTDGFVQMYLFQSNQTKCAGTFYFHQNEIQFCGVFRESKIITVSSDNQILISNIKYGMQQNGSFSNVNVATSPRELQYISVEKPTPKQIIYNQLNVRTKTLQQCLDLLFFELLHKLFILQDESSKQVKIVKQTCIQELTQAQQEFVEHRQNVYDQLSQLLIKNQTSKEQQHQMILQNTNKIGNIERELKQTYEDQIIRLRSDLQQMQSKHVLQKEVIQKEQEDYEKETVRLIKNEENITIAKINDLKKIYMQLLQDEQDLQQVSKQQLEEANQNYELRITELREIASSSTLNQSKDVKQLRIQQQQMETKQIKNNKELGQLKQQLNQKRSEVVQQQKLLQQSTDQQLLQKNEIFNKDITVQRKDEQQAQMALEREDLIKLKQLLNQRVNDLKHCVQPRDESIGSLQTQIQEMDAELIKDVNKKQKAELEIQDLKQKKQSLDVNIALKQKQIIDVEQHLKQLLGDINQFCTSYQQEYKLTNNTQLQKHLNNEDNFRSLDSKRKDYITALKVVYSKHVRKDLANDLQAKLSSKQVFAKNTNEINLQENTTNHSLQNINKILNTKSIKIISNKKNADSQSNSLSIAHQREYLEKSVATLNKSLERRRQQLNQAIEKARNQSSTLLGFSNLMRRENKELQQRVRDTKFKLAKKKQDLKLLSENLFGSVVAGMMLSPEPRQNQIQNVESPSMQQYMGEFQEKNLNEVLEEEFPIEGEQIPFINGMDETAATEPPEVLPQIQK